MKPKEKRKGWTEFSDSIYHLIDDDGYFLKDTRKKKRDPEEIQFEHLKRKRFRTPHEL